MPLSLTPTGDLTKDFGKLRAEIQRVRDDVALNPIDDDRKKLEKGLKEMLQEEASAVGGQTEKPKPAAESSSAGKSK